MDVECLFRSENTLLGTSSGSVLLTLFVMMYQLGLIISCVPVCSVDGGIVGAWDWGIQPSGCYCRVDLLWRGAVPTRAAYLLGSTENVRSTARCVCEAHLWEHCLVRDIYLLNLLHTLGGKLVNQTIGY